MGADQITIKYANRLQYNGNAKNKIPEGKGKLTFKNGATFQGEFIDGVPKTGKIRSGQYVYEGQCTKSQIKGNGTLIDKANILYEGLFQSGKLKNGQLKKKNANNEIIVTFKGDIENLSSFEGKGKMTIFLEQKESGKYLAQERVLEGNFENGNLHGNGKYILPNGDIYSGQFSNGKTANLGEYSSKQFTLLGDFSSNGPQGNSEVTFRNGDKYQGKMKEGQMHGKGKYTYNDGIIYEGDFYFGTLWGECTITYPKNSEIERYEGEINEGLYNGIGTLYYSNGIIFKGYFLQGAKNGYGVIIYGKDKYKCLYLMNQLSGELKLTS